MKLIVGNQKSYLDENQIESFLEKIDYIYGDKVIICPSSIYFNKFRDKNILLGSQNVSKYDSGATTGELSSEQLKSVGIDFSLVGHSERRQMLGESISDTNTKIKKLLNNLIVPILCVGETEIERDNENTKAVIAKQLDGALTTLDTDLAEKVIIAYEPVWAIGTGKIPTNSEIEDIVNYIKDLLKRNYNSSNLVLYGGSVNTKNIDELNKIDVVDGYLIGGASTKIDEFIEIINRCK